NTIKVTKEQHMSILWKTGFAALLALSGGAYAQSEVSLESPLAAAETTLSLSEGEVRKVNKDAQKITIRHGELKNLDMPPMTMVFQVQDPALLEKVQPGDQVSFEAEKIGGQFTVTHIEVRQ